MKRLLLLLGLLLCMASLSEAITVTHHNAGQGTSSGSATLAFSTNPTAGSWLGIGVVWAGGSPTITSVTTTIGGDTVTCRSQFTGASTNGEICYVENTAGGACTITVNWSAAPGDYGIQLVEVTGLASSGSFDVDIPGANSSGTTVTSGTYSTAQASEFAFVMLGDDLNCQTYTAGSGFTLLDTSTCTNIGQGAEYQIYSSTQSSVTASATYSATSTGACIRGAVFKAPGGAPVGTSKRNKLDKVDP